MTPREKKLTDDIAHYERWIPIHRKAKRYDAANICTEILESKRRELAALRGGEA